jgi:4-hydroxy-3-methylbut-2-enyl diphosphate reductase
MEVVCAKTAGFCMGVDRALKALNTVLAEKKPGRLVMFGPIIHNPQVLRYYTDKGVVCTENTEDLRPGDNVVIRAHGIPRDVEGRMNEIGVELVDATCPHVKAAQLAIAKATRGGVPLMLFGEEKHPEVRGLRSYADGVCTVFLDPKIGESCPYHPDEALVLAAQTTQDRGVFTAMADRMREKYSRLNVLSTICNATSKRQTEARALAESADAMVVIGGRTSGNTRRLADIVRSTGIPAYLVETAQELPLDELRAMKKIAVTAGASTPSDIISEVMAVLESL